MRVLILTLTLLCLASCDASRGPVEFCGIEGGHLDPEPVRFNLQEQRIFGSDVTYKYEIVETELLKGFVSPFPLVLPKGLSALNSPDRWELEGYVFTVTKVSSGDPDWILIHATPADSEQAPNTAQNTSVLFSFSRGVLALRWSSQHVEEETLAGEVFFCGTGRLDASKF